MPNQGMGKSNDGVDDLVSDRRTERSGNVSQNQDPNQRANATGDRQAFGALSVQSMVRALPGRGVFPDSRSCGERAADTITHPLRPAGVRKASRRRSRLQTAARLRQFNFNQSNGNRNSDSRRQTDNRKTGMRKETVIDEEDYAIND